MKRPTTLAALTHVEYLEQKINKIFNEIQNKVGMPSDKRKELYFELGKTYSDLELMKRVKPYD